MSQKIESVGCQTQFTDLQITIISPTSPYLHRSLRQFHNCPLIPNMDNLIPLQSLITSTPLQAEWTRSCNHLWLESVTPSVSPSKQVGFPFFLIVYFLLHAWWLRMLPPKMQQISPQSPPSRWFFNIFYLLSLHFFGSMRFRVRLYVENLFNCMATSISDLSRISYILWI